jgi:hypothetical protein
MGYDTFALQFNGLTYDCLFQQVTDYYDPKNLVQGHNSEMLLGKNLVDAAKAMDIKYLIWR